MHIIFTNDFIFHSNDEVVYHSWLMKLLRIPLKLSTGLDILPLEGLFSRKEFYKLSGFDEPGNYANYDISVFNERSWNYVRSFLNSNVFVVGVELGLGIRRFLSQENINFINFCFHPYKLMDDIYFLVNTNNQEVYEKINKYKLPNEVMQFRAIYWKERINRTASMAKKLKKNSCLFVGQSLKDRSVFDGEKFLSILDFKERLKELARKYSAIYYVPHPYAEYDESIEKYLEHADYIYKISDVPTYHLLASDNIRKVVSLSSSVLYEAEFFGKEIEYLFRPLFDIDSDFGENAFISIYRDYFCPSFWEDICSTVLETIPSPKMNFCGESANFIRDLLNNYHGYIFLEKNKLLERRIEVIERELIDRASRNKLGSKYLKYIKYFLMERITWGKRKDHYRSKLRKLMD